MTTYDITTYDILERTNQYIYTIRDIENIISNLQASIDDLDDKEQSEGLTADEERERDKLKSAKTTWYELLDKNVAYTWNQNLNSDDPDSFDDFKDGFDSDRCFFSWESVGFSYSII